MAVARYPLRNFASTPTFFIALCKIFQPQESFTRFDHSYVLTGAGESDFSTAYVFSATGKKFADELTDIDTDNLSLRKKLAHQYNVVMKTARESLDADVLDEPLLKRTHIADDKEYHLQYQAYEISYAQYEEYIRLLYAISPRQSFTYYFSTSLKEFKCSKEDNFSSTARPENKKSLPTLSTKKLTIFKKFDAMNTCRHGAVEILKQLGIPDETLSTNWMTNLPQVATVKNGRITTPLFVIPIPPDLQLKKDEPEFYHLIQTLHQDIQKLAMTNYGLELAHQKFTALRELYKSLCAGSHDWIAVNATVERWKEKKSAHTKETNFALINKTRQTFLFPFFNVSIPKSSAAVQTAQKQAATLPLDFKTEDTEGFTLIHTSGSSNSP
jgi:hypothetical protein